jgi:hypothetical protein
VEAVIGTNLVVVLRQGSDVVGLHTEGELTLRTGNVMHAKIQEIATEIALVIVIEIVIVINTDDEVIRLATGNDDTNAMKAAVDTIITRVVKLVVMTPLTTQLEW